VSQTEGPFFKPSSPLRTTLIEPGITGTKLVLTGYVLTTDCKPVVRALLDFWQANDQGAYDNSGFKLRGHLFTDDTGRYTLETIMPGLYPGRTRHIHVRVQAPNQPILTTQLYFPGEPRNSSDSIFHRALVISMQDVSSGKTGSFNFALKMT
jgi:protocatechuate 3,4-dioxygenase beta subunit